MAALAAGLVLLVGGALTTVAPVAAAPPERIPYTDEFDFVEHDYCDVEGFDVHLDLRFEGVLTIHERNGAEYWADHFNVAETHTANGTSISVAGRVFFKDLHVEEVEDTVVITFFGTGNDVVYGPDGKAIARNPGQVRFRVTIDAETDEELDFEVLKESTGRNDDFCEAVLPILHG